MECTVCRYWVDRFVEELKREHWDALDLCYVGLLLHQQHCNEAIEYRLAHGLLETEPVGVKMPEKTRPYNRRPKPVHTDPAAVQEGFGFEEPAAEEVCA